MLDNLVVGVPIWNLANSLFSITFDLEMQCLQANPRKLKVHNMVLPYVQKRWQSSGGRALPAPIGGAHSAPPNPLAGKEHPLAQSSDAHGDSHFNWSMIVENRDLSPLECSMPLFSQYERCFVVLLCCYIDVQYFLAVWMSTLSTYLAGRVTVIHITLCNTIFDAVDMELPNF